jgi:SAM-dependent methyltransferase
MIAPEVWASGEAYEPFVGRWSRRVAAGFVPWLGVHAGAHWLDVGCGTGALSQAILDVADPFRVRGVDPSAGYVAYATARVRDQRAAFGVGDATALAFVDGAFDVTVSGLVLNFVPQPDRAVAEMARATRPGGTIGVYVWDYADGMQPIRRFWDAACDLDPAARTLDEGVRFPTNRPDALRSLFLGAGLSDVDVGAIAVPTDYRDFEDYWTPFLGGQGPAPAYAASLASDARETLRAHRRSTLPVEADGSIHLTARAWTARGTRRGA